MAVFLPQTKHYRKSQCKKRDKKRKLIKSQESFVRKNETLDINSIYRENQNNNLCKKHALVTVMSGVLTERKISETQHTVHEHKQNDNIKSKRRRRRKGSKRKWSAQNVLSAKKYNKYCDEFDAMNNFEIGCSRKYFIVGAKMTDNIFCYILQQYHIKSDYIAFDHEDGSIGKLLDYRTEKCHQINCFQF
eukprot:771673_1